MLFSKKTDLGQVLCNKWHLIYACQNTHKYVAHENGLSLVFVSMPTPGSPGVSFFSGEWRMVSGEWGPSDD